jgi:hypothetical protein
MLACLAWLLAAAAAGAAPPSDEQQVGKADAALFQALASADTKAAAALLDDRFTWTGSDGRTLTLLQFRAAPPKPGPYVGTDLKLKIYGRIAVITTDLDRVHALRVWVKLAKGWRALVYQEVTVAPTQTAAAAPITAACENPCLTVPYTPRTVAQRDAIAAWQALERAVAKGDADAWATHVADAFVVVSNSRVQDKAARIAAVKQGGSAPAPLVSASFIDVGDTLVMSAQHQPYDGKPVHVTRVWIKRTGAWLMAISYQTTMAAAPAG